MSLQRFCSLSILASCACLYLSTHPANSQIVPDNTTDTSVVNDCQNSCNITGGTMAGKNLFHSFREFNINSGQNVYFNDPGVANIFSRVTGNNASEIFGTLGVSGGDANLFLLNPNGILFGAGAVLDINGSFLATTADSIEFGTGNFSANRDPQENLALLTVAPSALFFNQMGQNQPIEINSGTILQVPNGESITLLGKQSTPDNAGIELDFGGVFASQGNIFLGALGEGGRIEIEPKLRLKFPDNLSKGDISLARGSGINADGAGGGNIFLEGNNITLIGESNLFASTLSDLDGGSINIVANNLTIAENSKISTTSDGAGKSSDIDIVAEESVNLLGDGIEPLQQLLTNSVSELSEVEINTSSINTIAREEGASGNIAIATKNLNLNNGAWILSTTTGVGNAGAVKIQVDESTAIDRSGLLTGTDLGSKGNAGTLTLESNNLLLQNNGIIASSTVGSGRGGNINLTIADGISLRQSLPDIFLPTGIYTNTVIGSGAAGNLTIDTDKLKLEDGAGLSSGSGTLTNRGFISLGGRGGNIAIDAESIQISGISPNNRFPSGIINRTYSNNPAGDITIRTGELSLQKEAIISASSVGAGAGGDLTIDAEQSIHLSGTSFLNLQNLFLQGLSGEIDSQDITGGLLTNTEQGEAGNTKISTSDLVLENGALISTSTFGEADGGNIDISANNIEVVSSLISSSTTGSGHAGNIRIFAEKLTTRDSGLITTSSIGLGNGGDIKLDVSDRIALLDLHPNGFIPGGLSTTSVGFSYPGNIEINTQDLIIRGGQRIDASNGRLQNLIGLEFSNSFILPENTNFDSPREIIINAESIDIADNIIKNNITFTSGINSATTSLFPASNILIDTSVLSLDNNSKIELSSLANGLAGNLTVNADKIFLNMKSELNANTISGSGGNIDLKIKEILTLGDFSTIATNALDIGDGGNIKIDTDFILVSRNSNISANALSGQGGNIGISATDLFISRDSQITASSQLGIDGQINIKTFNNNHHNSIVKLIDKVISADNLIAQKCVNNTSEGSEFSYIGKGGLPPSLLAEYGASRDRVIPDFSINNKFSTAIEIDLERDLLNPPEEKIIEASTWKLNQQGNIELLAPRDRSIGFAMSKKDRCPFISNK